LRNNDSRSNRNGVRRRSAAPAAGGASVNEELLSIPRLGQVRLEALAAAGVSSLDDLRKMALEDLAAIKWIGLGNAKLIKGWLETNSNGAAEAAPAKPATRRSRAAKPAAADAETPPAPARPRARRTKAQDATTEEIAVLPAPKPRATRSSKAQPVVDVEAAVVDAPAEAVIDPLIVDCERVDSAVTRIKDAIPKKSREKKLGRQLKKVAQSVSDLPQSAGDLAAESKAAAVEALDRIAGLLNSAVESGKLSAKKQEAMSADLKKIRKRLEKVLGG